jgi:hypothetical protein
VYRRVRDSRREIVLYDIANATSSVIAHSKRRVDLGPPDISYPRVVYHRTGENRSSLAVYRVDRGTTKVVRTTVRYSYFNPSIAGRAVVYVYQTLRRMQVRLLNLRTDRGTELYSLSKGSNRFLWTTGISGSRRYFTVYDDSSSWIERG